MENTNEEQSIKPQGQEINASFKADRGRNPNDDEVLEKDLIKKYEETEEDDGQVVKSSDPGSQEWQAREDQNEKEQ